MVGVSGGGMDKSIYDSNADGVVQTCEYVEQGQIKKKKSDTLKHSHDAQADKDTDAPDGHVYSEVKRITFTTGLQGAIRVKWSCKNDFSQGTLRGWSKLVDKDGTIIGTEHDNGASNTTLFTYTEDIDAADFKAGEYIAIHAKNHAVSVAGRDIEVTAFRIYYDENPEDFANA